MNSVKKVKISINTTEKHLEQAGTSVEDLQNAIEYLAGCFGTKYQRMFPTKIGSNDTDRILYVVDILKKIESCDGFSRHIKQYDKNNIEDHLFAAKTAGWFLDQDYKVTLEPELESPEGKKPDLFIEKEGHERFVTECKNHDITDFFKKDDKQMIADIIYKKVQTCDQIDLYLKQNIAPEKIKEIFDNTELISKIHKMGMSKKETRFAVNENLEIGIIQKPAIMSKEEDFPTVTMGMFLEDNATKERLPGYAFMKGGRSIGVFAPPPDYSSRWKNNRSKSKEQAIDGLPMVVMVNGDNVLGDYELHKEFFNKKWLTKENAQCSGVGLLHFTTQSGKPELEYFENPEAEYPFQL